MLLKKAQKMQNMSFSRNKMNQNKTFWMQFFLKNWLVEKTFFQI